MAYKTKTWDRTVYRGPTKWDTYQRNASGQYVFIGSGTGSEPLLKRDILTRSWNTQVGWREFRTRNGYLPTMGMTESHDYVIQSDTVPSHFCYGGSYRVDMKTPDQVYVPQYSGVRGFDTYGCHSTQELADLRAEAKQKCLAKARNMKVHLPVMLGEGRKTVSMIADAVRTLGTAYSDFRRGRFRQAAKKLGMNKPPSGEAARHWLAYQMGWAPTIADAQGLLELAEKGVLDTTNADGTRRGPRFGVSATATSSKRWKGTSNGTGSLILGGGETTFDMRGVVKAKAALLLEYQLEYSGLNSIGLGTYDLTTLVWELTPFSFLFDYFIEIGKYLESLSALDGLTVLAGYESHIETVFGTATMRKPESSGWTAGLLPTADVTWRSYRRDNWIGSISLRKPIFDALNARRITNMAALMRVLTMGDRNGSYRP